MPSAPLIQLVSISEEDLHLTGNPEITHFKSVFRRHVRFSKETTESIISESGEKFGNKFTIPINKVGDLLGPMYLEVDISGKSSFDTTNEQSYCTVNHFGNSLLKTVEFEIGGVIIETLYSQWLQIWKELNPEFKNYEYYNQISSVEQGGKAIPIFTPGKGWDENYWSYDTNKISMPNRLMGDCPLVFGGSSQKNGLELNSNIDTNGESFNTLYTKKIYIPIPFWFTKNPGLFIPIKRILNSEINVKIEFEEKSKLIGKSSNISDLELKKINLLTEFYHLEETFASRFSNNTHEYLIEIVQRNQTIASTNTSINTNNTTELGEQTIDLLFKHPIKYITWAVGNPGTDNDNTGQGPCYFISQCSNSQQGNDGNDGSARLIINNQDLTNDKALSYYTRLLPMKYCNHIPDLDRIAIYSFALNPFSLSPSGSCNFSRLNKGTVLKLKLANKHRNTVFNVVDNQANKNLNIHIFAIGYNILKVTQAGVQKLYN